MKEQAAPVEGDIVGRIENEVVYVLSRRGQGDLLLLLSLLRDVFPDCSPTALAAAFQDLVARGVVLMSREVRRRPGEPPSCRVRLRLSDAVSSAMKKPSAG